MQISQVNKTQAQFKVLKERPSLSPPYPPLKLFLSLCRLNKIDFIVEKAVELGVSELHLFFSDRSFFKTTNSQISSRMKRWNKIIRSATQQCGRSELMKLKAPTPLDSLLSQREDHILGVFAYEGEAKNFKSHLQKKPSCLEVWVFVGSEGGFSPQEVRRFQSMGWEPVSLGSQVLRVETACLSLVSVLNYELER